MRFGEKIISSNPKRGAVKLIITLLSTTVLIGIAAHAASADSLEVVTSSKEFRVLAAEQSDRKQYRPPKTGSFYTPYEALFVSERAPRELLNWLGVQIPGWKITNQQFRITGEVALASVSLTNKQKTIINVLAQVPKPELQILATNNALLSFKRLRPPFIKVIASHPIDVQDTVAEYLRTADGSCRIQIKTTKNAFIELKTPRCANSKQMLQFAKKLNLKRFNGKLSQ